MADRLTPDQLDRIEANARALCGLPATHFSGWIESKDVLALVAMARQAARIAELEDLIYGLCVTGEELLTDEQTKRLEVLDGR